MSEAGRGLHRTRRGLDLPVAGAPAQEVSDGNRVARVAILAEDYPGIRPRLKVGVGEAVSRGQPLFEDRESPGVIHTSPAAGRVVQINRGERRALRSLVVELDEGESPAEVAYPAFDGRPPSELRAFEARALLQQSGLWTALRARPFGRVPAADAEARSCFVTAIDTQPLAPSVEKVVERAAADFEAGLRLLVALMDGRPVHLCVRDGSSLAKIAADGVAVHRFDGPHPAGNPGLHMHLVDPVDRGRYAWHIGYQDTIAAGRLARTGRMMVERVVALGGPAINRPRLVTTRLGASVGELTDGEIGDVAVRVVSGSVLNGRDAADPSAAFLGRYHLQVTALPDRPGRRFLGWMAPGFSAFSATRLFASSFLPRKEYAFDTAMNGGVRAMVPGGGLAGVMPFDLMPGFLFRAILAGDLERAESLGCLELEPEDVALCTFVCPSKIDYGAALRRVLDQIEKEG